MNFFTFCVYIRKHRLDELDRALQLLVNSLENQIKDFNLIVYTNYNSKVVNKNIKFRMYYDNSKIKLYKDEWLNLSFNKINIYRDLHTEFNKDYIWVDLDTIVTADISYLDSFSNIFVENGGNCSNPNILFTNNPNITVPRNNYIQGNFWKLNINLYNELMETFKKIQEKKLILRYDLQDLFSYHYYYVDSKNINILGKTCMKDTLNGLAQWSLVGNTHATMEGLENLYWDSKSSKSSKKVLKSNFYNEKEIHILSFTFNTLKKMYSTVKFKELFCPMKVFIINLPERTDRKNETIEEMKKQGIKDYTFFPAIKPRIEEIPPNFIPNKSDKYRIGCWGCLQSHLLIIKLAKEKNISSVLIFEDDVQFIGKLHNLYISLSEIPEDWEMLYLSGNHQRPCKKYSNNTVLINGSYSACSYVLNSKYYNHVINILEKATEEVDVEFCKRIHPLQKSYCVYPHITTQRPSYSNILHRNVNYSEVIKNPSV